MTKPNPADYRKAAEDAYALLTRLESLAASLPEKSAPRRGGPSNLSLMADAADGVRVAFLNAHAVAAGLERKAAK